jgi:hypothetical protein
MAESAVIRSGPPAPAIGWRINSEILCHVPRGGEAHRSTKRNTRRAARICTLKSRSVRRRTAVAHARPLPRVMPLVEGNRTVRAIRSQHNFPAPRSVGKNASDMLANLSPIIRASSDCHICNIGADREDCPRERLPLSRARDCRFYGFLLLLPSNFSMRFVRCAIHSGSPSSCLGIRCHLGCWRRAGVRSFLIRMRSPT